MKTTNEYLDSMHRLGRLGALGAIFISLLIPTIISIAFDIFPGFLTIITTSAGLLAIFIPLAISEVISYTPVLGSSIYLTLITGNVMNLKLPVAANSVKLLNIEQGTEKGDVISAIAIGVSSIATVVIIAIGTLLMVPLKPVLLTPEVQTASHYILPALFGALALSLLSGNVGGGVVIKGRMKAAVIPALIVAAVFFVSPMLAESLSGVLIIVAIPITYFSSKFLYKRGQIKVILPTDTVDDDQSGKTEVS